MQTLFSAIYCSIHFPNPHILLLTVCVFYVDILQLVVIHVELTVNTKRNVPKPTKQERFVYDISSNYFVDGPQEITITGPTPAASVGETFLCETDSNPPASYEWDLLAGAGPIHVEGDTLTVDVSMTSPSRYRCTASSDMGNSMAEVEFLVGTFLSR